jgi:protein-S-isoprenylcysteine O-methyltransferase Ste14
VGSGDPQFTGLHHLRLQLQQAAIASRLAFVWRFQRLHCRAVYRDVWLSVDDLPAFRLAASALSWHGLDVALWVAFETEQRGPKWNVLFQAQRRHALATTGAYAYIRHPQYVGFIIIMLGFLLQWPTVLTLLMFPLLVAMYVRLARLEEADGRRTFGAAYDAYAAVTAAWFPRLGGPRSADRPMRGAP